MKLDPDPRLSRDAGLYASLIEWARKVVLTVNERVTLETMTGGFSISIGAAGYITLPTWMGGLIIQWATSVVTTDPSGNASIIFPIAFPNTIRNVVVSNGDSAQGNLLVMSYLTGWPTLFGHAINVRTANTGANLASAPFRCNWVAFGN